ncbi:MAG: metallophosphoesterase [Saprospiraceae bacterium]|uniref:Metallophosphoesterase n=1 Tax=Candidatus Opimibacter skivensis TaxID=2982028 RepID=A0A9D7SRX0_9BACT|nr:metallophosphoesterase [Candidatus Opimibacter skivensis]
MKIQYASDLHLEFSDNKEFLLDHPLEPLGDVLILAGDIVPFKELDKHQDFFSYISDHFHTTWWIPGNHEYYHSDISTRSGFMHEAILPNVYLVNNFSTTYQELRFIFSTLWSLIRPEHQWQIWQGLNDFKCISNGKNKLSVDDFNHMHQNCLEFITNELNRPFDGKSIVTTHHVPTFFNYPEKYRGDKLNEGFAVELYDLILQAGPDYWLFGHHHQNMDEFRIGNTQLMTNQVGYVQYNEHKGFQTNKFITI